MGCSPLGGESGGREPEAFVPPGALKGGRFLCDVCGFIFTPNGERPNGTGLNGGLGVLEPIGCIGGVPWCPGGVLDRGVPNERPGGGLRGLNSCPG